MYSHTIAIARCLLSEGRTREVEEMIYPLLLAYDRKWSNSHQKGSKPILLLRCLLAQAWLLSDTKPEEARQMLLPIATPHTQNISSSLPQALALLWLGWSYVLTPTENRDIPHAIHLLKTSRKQLEHFHRGDYLYWCHIGLALALSKLGERTQMHEVIKDALRYATFTEDILAKKWTGTLVDQPAPSPVHESFNLMHASYTMRNFLHECRLIAEGTMPVLFIGERGVGKEVTGKLIHASSGFLRSEFKCLNCEAISSTQFSNQLPFTHQVENAATPRTIFLNHVDKLPFNLQERLLDFVRTQVDGASLTPLPRLFASTSIDLDALVQQNQFNRDLYNILQIHTLNVPPLRSRKADIPLLALHFTHSLCPDGVPFVAITEEALTAMLRYDWPGNIRQLRNEMERAITWVANEPASVIDLKVLPKAIQKNRQGEPLSKLSLDISQSTPPLDDVLAQTEKRFIEQVLATHNGQVSISAAQLGLTRQGLYKKMKRLGISVSQFQEDIKNEPRELLN